ncbi:MAG: hypothetical protein IPN08_06855 [Bacteroidales bacterium]|nr:hypothetical protein [Bacteroidales bacterium]
MVRKKKKKIEETLSGLHETSHADYLVLQDALEVLRWYIHFIAVKFSRASLALSKIPLQDVLITMVQPKIAIIAVNRSIEALALLLRFIPSEEDVLLEALVRLERIKNAQLRYFLKRWILNVRDSTIET